MGWDSRGRASQDSGRHGRTFGGGILSVTRGGAGRSRKGKAALRLPCSAPRAVRSLACVNGRHLQGATGGKGEGGSTGQLWLGGPAMQLGAVKKQSRPGCAAHQTDERIQSERLFRSERKQKVRGQSPAGTGQVQHSAGKGQDARRKQASDAVRSFLEGIFLFIERY